MSETYVARVKREWGAALGRDRQGLTGVVAPIAAGSLERKRP